MHFVPCTMNLCARTMQLLFIRAKKKNGNVKLKTQTRNKPNPNGQVVMLIFLLEVVVLVYNQIWSQTFLLSKNELLINALRVPTNRTLNYQGQGFSPNKFGEKPFKFLIFFIGCEFWKSDCWIELHFLFVLNMHISDFV